MPIMVLNLLAFNKLNFVYKMKSYPIYWICTILIVLISCKESVDRLDFSSYKLGGKVDSFDLESNVTLEIFDPVSQSGQPVDTAHIDDQGKFVLVFDYVEPDLYRLKLPNKQVVMLAIGEEQNTIKVHAEGKRNGYVTIQGSPDSRLLLQYDSVRQESNIRLIKPAYQAMTDAKGNAEQEIETVKRYVENSNIHRKELLDFSEEYLKHSIALYGTMLRWTGDDEISRLDRLVTGFEELYPNLSMTQKMRDKVHRYQKVAIGSVAPDIKGENAAGDSISLYSSLGKITLIDFWASWCRPCLLQIPELQEVYQQFHAKGFEIFGVSVDTKDQNWKDAIVKYDMKWPQCSESKGWKSKLAADYNVTFIPYNILVNSQGEIIAKNLHSKLLHDKIEEFLR